MKTARTKSSRSKTKSKRSATPEFVPPPTPAAADVAPDTTRSRIARMYRRVSPRALSTETLAPAAYLTDATATVTESPTKDLAVPPPSGVDFDQTQQLEPLIVAPQTRTSSMDQTVTLTLKGISKSQKQALYAGLRTVSRLSVTDFPNNTPPLNLTISGDLAGPREKLTPEERKARAKARPKPTLAERIAKEEKRIAKWKEKLAAQAQPQGEPVAV